MSNSITASKTRNQLDGAAAFGGATVHCNAKDCTASIARAIAEENDWTFSIAPERGCLPDGTPRVAWYCPLHSGCHAQSEEVSGAVTTGLVWQYRIKARKVSQDGHNALETNGWAWEETDDPNVIVAVSEKRANAKDRSEGFDDLEDRRRMGRLVLGGNQLGVTFTIESKLDKEMWDTLELAFPTILERMQQAFRETPAARSRILGSHISKLDMTVQGGILTGRCYWDSDHQVEECCRMGETVLHLWATWYDRKGAIEKTCEKLETAIKGEGFPQSKPNWHYVNQKRGWRK